MPTHELPALHQLLEVHEVRIQRLEDSQTAQREVTAGLKVEVAACTESVNDLGEKVEGMPRKVTGQIMESLQPLVLSNTNQEAGIRYLRDHEDARTEASRKRADWASRWKALAFTAGGALAAAIVKLLVDHFSK